MVRSANNFRQQFAHNFSHCEISKSVTSGQAKDYVPPKKSPLKYLWFLPVDTECQKLRAKKLSCLRSLDVVGSVSLKSYLSLIYIFLKFPKMNDLRPG